MARAADELGAAVEGMENATQKILKSIEVIDESARALTATLKDDYERGLAQDIQDHVVQIYEACNFQDLAGQRIGNVIAHHDDRSRTRCGHARSLQRHRRPRSAAAAPRRASHGLLNGPKLDGDPATPARSTSTRCSLGRS